MNNFSISDLEATVQRQVKTIFKEDKAGVYSNRPKSTRPMEDNFFVVRVADSIVDMGAYGTCTLAIDIFVKDAETLKNNKRLDYLQTKLLENIPLLFPSDRNEFELENTPRVLGDTPDDYGYHARIITFSTIIKVQ